MKKNAKAAQKPVSTIIGADTIIGGSLTTENSIRIDGSVVGGITSKGTVILSPTGKVTGNIVAEFLVVAGTIEGDMWIRERAEFESTADITGDITTTRLIIDEDARFQGMSIMAKEVEIPDLNVPKDDDVQESAETEADAETAEGTSEDAEGSEESEEAEEHTEESED